MDTLSRSFDASHNAASWAVVVDAKDDKAKAFYQKYGFIPLINEPMKLFLPMDSIEKSFY